MTVRHLKVFICVAEKGGFTKAAEILRIAQPAVSQTIADIENYYGVILFDRINGKSVLTESGRELLIKAKECAAAFDDFESAAFSVQKRPALHIGASLTLGKDVLPDIVKHIYAEYPNIKLKLTIKNTREIENAILNGAIDFGLVEGKAASRYIRAENFSTDRLLTVCAEEYCEKDEITLKELSAMKLCLRERGSASRDYLETLFDTRGLTIRPTLEAISNTLIGSFVQQGLGAAVLPESEALPLINEGSVKLLKVTDAELTRNSYLIVHRVKKFTPAQKSIYDYCRSLFN